MSILDEIARGTRTTPLDVAQAKARGKKDYLAEQGIQQELKIQALKMEEWLEDRDREQRLRSSMEGHKFNTPEETRKASEAALQIGEFKTAMELEQLALKQIPKKDKKYGAMKEVTSNGKLIGYAQIDQDGKYHNFKTLKSITGKGSLTKVTKPSRPSKEQIETAIDWAKNSDTFGEVGLGNLGFSNKDYKRLGRTIASRAQKLIVDAKQLNQSISDEEAMDLAAQEIEAMGSTIYKDDFFGKSLKGDITFPAGMSSKILEFYGVDSPQDKNNEEFMKMYNSLPSGAEYIDPNGVKRIKG